MTKVKAQEDKERFYLKKFLEVIEVKVKPDAIDRGENPPDFCFTYLGKRIAVELTEFHSNEIGEEGHSRRAVEEEWQDIQEVFREKRKGFPELNDIKGYLFFKELNVPSSRQHEQFVRELLMFARVHLLELTEKEREYDDFPDDQFPLLREYLSKLSLCNAGCYIDWEWNRAGGWGGVSEDELKKTTLPKLCKPRPDNVNENWLLIVSGPQTSQFMGRPSVETFKSFDDINQAINNGSYDKVFILQYMSDRVLLWQRSSGWSENYNVW